MNPVAFQDRLGWVPGGCWAKDDSGNPILWVSIDGVFEGALIRVSGVTALVGSLEHTLESEEPSGHADKWH